MNQDVLNIQVDDSQQYLSDRLNWDWRNPLIALPITAVGVVLVSVFVIVLGLLGA